MIGIGVTERLILLVIGTAMLIPLAAVAGIIAYVVVKKRKQERNDL